jgi:hypothetical protein
MTTQRSVNFAIAILMLTAVTFAVGPGTSFAAGWVKRPDAFVLSDLRPGQSVRLQVVTLDDTKPPQGNPPQDFVVNGTKYRATKIGEVFTVQADGSGQVRVTCGAQALPDAVVNNEMRFGILYRDSRKKATRWRLILRGTTQ